MDRETVIKGLERCVETQENMEFEDCQKCPYQDEEHCSNALMIDTLSLLREQEAVKPVKEQIFSFIFGWNCGACGFPLLSDGYTYCPNCGRSVKWE